MRRYSVCKRVLTWPTDILKYPSTTSSYEEVKHSVSLLWRSGCNTSSFPGKHDEYGRCSPQKSIFSPLKSVRTCSINALLSVYFLVFQTFWIWNAAHFHVVYLLVIKNVCKGLYSFLPFCIFLLIKPRESPQSLSLVSSLPVFCYHIAVRKSMTIWRYRRHGQIVIQSNQI